MRARQTLRASTFAVLIGAVLGVSAQATVYTWTDHQGVRHYSDTPQATGARVADVSPVPGLTSTPGASPSSAPVSNAANVLPPGDDRALKIVSPQPDQVFANDEGRVAVSVIVGRDRDTAAPADGETLQYVLDGSPVGKGPTPSTRLTLSNVAAGTHALTVALLYRGHVVQHSHPVSFRVAQAAAKHLSDEPPPAPDHGRPPS